MFGLAIAACALTPPVTCAADAFDAPARPTCDTAVIAARPQLAIDDAGRVVAEQPGLLTPPPQPEPAGG